MRIRSVHAAAVVIAAVGVGGAVAALTSGAERHSQQLLVDYAVLAIVLAFVGLFLAIDAARDLDHRVDRIEALLSRIADAVAAEPEPPSTDGAAAHEARRATGRA